MKLKIEYIIKEIWVEGITRLAVDIKTDCIEVIRRECAHTYAVSTSKVKFMYEEHEEKEKLQYCKA